jgi:hypothetical protein
MTTNLSFPPTLSQLSDGELLTQIKGAVAAERQATRHLIALLIELDSRRLYLVEGYSSMFTYCTQALHLSEHAAYNRIEAARAARRFPVIVELFEDGAITLTSIRLLAPHLTPENHREVLEKVRHKSKREVETLVAGLHPQPDAPAFIRKLPGRSEAASSLLQRDAAPVRTSHDVPAASGTPATRQSEVKPLAPERYKIQFTASREMYDKLRRAQDLLRHSVPNGDPAEIFGRALTLLVSQLERRKTAASERPRCDRDAPLKTRYIPASVKRVVWKRDGGRCAFVGTNERCSETGFLEYHHVVPFAAGGETSAANLQLRCRAHNQHEAAEYFGLPLMMREQPIEYAG